MVWDYNEEWGIAELLLNNIIIAVPNFAILHSDLILPQITKSVGPIYPQSARETCYQMTLVFSCLPAML